MLQGIAEWSSAIQKYIEGKSLPHAVTTKSGKNKNSACLIAGRDGDGESGEARGGAGPGRGWPPRPGRRPPAGPRHSAPTARPHNNRAQ